MSITFLILGFAFLLEILQIIKDFNQGKDRQGVHSNRKLNKKNISPKRKRINGLLLTVRIVVAFGLFYLTIAEINYNNLSKKIESKYGQFESLESTSEEITYPIVNFGTLISERNRGEDFGYSGQSSKTIRVRKMGNKLNAIINIRDAFGNMVAGINGDTWKIYDNNGIDYNNDDNGYEIVTGDHQVIFQMYLKGDTVYCYGLICSENGYCSYASKDGFMGPFNRTNNQRFPIPPNISTPLLFRYPREKYLGQRQENFPY